MTDSSIRVRNHSWSGTRWGVERKHALLEREAQMAERGIQAQ